MSDEARAIDLLHLQEWPAQRERETSKDKHDAEMLELSQLNPGRTICGRCGVVVAEGRLDKGKDAFKKHLADEHPEIEEKLPKVRAQLLGFGTRELRKRLNAEAV